MSYCHLLRASQLWWFAAYLQFFFNVQIEKVAWKLVKFMALWCLVRIRGSVVIKLNVEMGSEKSFMENQSQLHDSGMFVCIWPCFLLLFLYVYGLPDNPGLSTHAKLREAKNNTSQSAAVVQSNSEWKLKKRNLTLSEEWFSKERKGYG